VNSVTFTPLAPAATDTSVSATVSASDADSDPLTYTYVWQLNNTTVQTTTASSNATDNLDLTNLPGGVTVKSGDLLALTVTPNDGKIAGTPKATSVTIS